MDITFSIIFLAVILFPLFDALYFYNFTIKSWESTDGEIIKNAPVSDGDGGRTRDIRYIYNVDGVEYTNDKVTRNVINVPFEYKSTFKYTPGTKLKIYYDPNNPKKSIIENTFNPLTLVAVFMGVSIFAIFYLLFMI